MLIDIKNIADCYQILEIAPEATQEEVKRSYRELVKVWHPDRFSSDPKLQKKAQEKLKQINLAYEWICKGEAGGPRRRTAPAGTSKSQSGGQSRSSGSSGSTKNQGEPRTEAPRHPPPPQTQPASAPTTNWGRRIVQFAVTVLIIAVVKEAFSTSNRSRRKSYTYEELMAEQRRRPTDYAPPYNQPNRSSPNPEEPAIQPTPRVRQHLTLDQVVELHSEAIKLRSDLRLSVTEFSRYMQTNQPEYDFSEGIAYSLTPIPEHTEPVPPKLSASGLERLILSDKPDSGPGEMVAPSKPTLDRTRIVEVALSKTGDSFLPTPSRDFFTVGSTKDEVLVVQGTPSQFNDSSFTYGNSTVEFRNGKVASWYDGYPKLKVKLLPVSKVEAADFFTVGSTKDEVLVVQGTPSQFNDSSFTYGNSTVNFRNGKVASWYDGYPKLKARLSTVSQPTKQP